MDFEQQLAKVGRCHEEVGTQLGHHLRCREQRLESQILLNFRFLENLGLEAVCLVFGSQT